MVRDKAHLEFIRSLPSVLSGKLPCVAAHIRKYGDGGAGLKPSDIYALPLTQEEHDRQHAIGELSFWGGEQAVLLARELATLLYDETGNRKYALGITYRYMRKIKNVQGEN